MQRRLLATSLAVLACCLEALSQAPSTLIAVKTTCELVNPNYCQGAFGFVIEPDGRWQAGPNPASGHVVTGQITAQQLFQLRGSVTDLLTHGATLPRNCVVRPRIPGITETVVLRAQGEAITLVGAAGKLDEACGSVDSESAKLFAMIDSMREYYPRPFP